jgi:hypothetical protein
MAYTLTGNYNETVEDVMNLMAPSAGGAIPEENSEEYGQWLLFIQTKYEEASRRGFWRRLLKKSTLSLTEGDTEVLLPVDFQRANGLYILYVDEVDLCDPDREPDGQGIFAEIITDPADDDFGRWRLTFTQSAPIWYFCSPPKPGAAADKILLPGDMIAFGALSEVFRTTNLEGSQDDARNEYENRLSTYLAVEMIPPRNEILTFVTNPRGADRLRIARNRYTAPRSGRQSRM